MALTPERIAELERLKALMQPLATEAQRKAQAIWNAEQMAKQVPGKKKGGLEKFLEPSKVKQRLYHGTKKDIKKFDSKNIGANDFGWYGRGHYLTADPGTASAYTSYDDILATGKLQNSAGHGANVMPLHVQARNPYYWPEGRKAATSKEESEALTKELLGLGHDSVIVGNKYQDPQYAKHHEVVLFDPRKIKSAIGNRGTYDINDPDITKAQGGTVNPFDYENPEHVSAVAGHAAKHKDFKQYGPQMMAEVLSTGHHQHLEDPRIQHAMRQAGHNAYHVQEKTGKTLHKMAQPVVKKAMGGQVQPSIAQMKMALNQNKFPSQSAISSIGAEEAPDMPVKAYVPPAGGQDGQLPVGGIDMSEITPGMQYMPEEQKEMQPPGQPGQPGQPPQPPMSPSAGPSSPGQQSNILQMTPQGQAMAAMQPTAVKPQMASGGPVPVQNRPFISAGQKPYPFMAKVGGSDNMPMDNQSMDNGATTFDIDNIQELNQGGNVQGYSSKGKVSKRQQTVKNAQRMAYPGIYGNPAEIAALAASRVAPEDPLLKQLFGVTRADMYQQSKGRQGMPHLGMLPGAAANPKGSMATEGVMNKRNEQRLLDVMAEAQKHQGLAHGMEPWYYMNPFFDRMVQLLGIEKATQEYKKMNALMGMASSSSEVNTEIPRGSLAYWLQNQGRFDEFVKHGGKRSEDRPADFGATPGHLAHKTAHALPMQKFLERGEVDMNSPKVPMYIEASGVPATGFQTRTPVGDAHWSRAVGLADTRNPKTIKGQEVVPGASVSTPEMSALGPWWRHKIAQKLGLESVPAQALAWGAFSPQTGVTTPIGAPKLELLARQIGHTAKRLGVNPETARDLVLTGKERMGYKKGGKVASSKLSDNLDTMRLALTKKKAK